MVDQPRYSIDSIVEIRDLDGSTLRVVVEAIGAETVTVREANPSHAEDAFSFAAQRDAVLRTVGINW